MNYKIEKTSTENEIMDFKAQYLQDCHQQGYNLTFAEDDDYIYALEPFEILQDGEIVNISNTPEYIAEQAAKEKEAQNIEIQKQLDELDKKRIRAICEGGEKEQGKTWLAYYNEQAVNLRSRLNEV